MTQPAIGQPAPDFEAAATGDQTVRLKDLKGRNVILYFYPKDSTPGCTTEGQNFRDLQSQFENLDTTIFGVSRDSLRSHENFKNKQAFNFELLSDPDETVCRAYDVIKLKKMYGRESLGVERSTLLIDKTGVLRREWRKVKVKGHVDEVLAAVQELP